ncbi:MAG: hypothetical protein Ct9H300mP16_13350 [Pseudomonadota bacterium]|nr:MAG: hypothetical protein Ct9H300mP16_13350 [Pseudomonadota bacterium]
MVGLDLPLSPLEHHYLLTETIPEVEAMDFELPMTVDLEGFTYMRQDQNGILVGIYEINHQHWNIDGAPGDYGIELIQENTDRIADELEMAFNRYPLLRKWASGTGSTALSHFRRRQSTGGSCQRSTQLLARLRCYGRLPSGRWRGKTLAEWMIHGEPNRLLANGHRPLR